VGLDERRHARVGEQPIDGRQLAERVSGHARMIESRFEPNPGGRTAPGDSLLLALTPELARHAGLHLQIPRAAWLRLGPRASLSPNLEVVEIHLERVSDAAPAFGKDDV
jgi:hypothetical protein